MNTNENEVVSARVKTYSFDNGTLTFSIDLLVVAREISPDGDASTISQGLIESLVDWALKSLIHRSGNRPAGKGEDATEWLLEVLSGSEAGGRFKITAKDKERAATALKSYKMAPEQIGKQFFDLYGIDLVPELDWLSKHYMGVRAKAAAAAKAAVL